MKKIIFIAIYFMFSALTVNSQKSSTISVVDSNTVLTIVQEMPEFPGGEPAMIKFIESNLSYPQSEAEANIAGTCFLAFIIEKDGSISNINVLKGIGAAPGYDKEAVRVVSVMPKWKPGRQNGKEVRVNFYLPVRFKERPYTHLRITDTVFFDRNWQQCSKEYAEYFRITEVEGNSFLVKDMFMKTNTPQMVSQCSSYDPVKLNGRSVFYYPGGAKKKEGDYENDRETGTWIHWDEDGKDSTVLKYEKSRQTFIHISKNEPYNNGDDIAELVEVWPEYAEGEIEMMRFIQKNIKYPVNEMRAGISGTCYITFIVEKDGSLSGIRTLRGVKGGPGCDAEAIRVIALMPKWKPGTINGKKIRVKFNLPIKFTLSEKRK